MLLVKGSDLAQDRHWLNLSQCGSSLSLRGFSRLSDSLSLFWPWVRLCRFARERDSRWRCALRSFTWFEPFACGFQATGSSLSFRNLATCGSSLSLLDTSRFAASLFLTDFSNLRASVSLRNFCTLGASRAVVDDSGILGDFKVLHSFGLVVVSVWINVVWICFLVV